MRKLRHTIQPKRPSDRIKAFSLAWARGSLPAKPIKAPTPSLGLLNTAIGASANANANANATAGAERRTNLVGLRRPGQRAARVGATINGKPALHSAGMDAGSHA